MSGKSVLDEICFVSLKSFNIYKGTLVLVLKNWSDFLW